MKWYLFSLCARVSEEGVERGSEWVDDAWLAREIAGNASLDRCVELPEAPGRGQWALSGKTLPWPGSAK